MQAQKKKKKSGHSQTVHNVTKTKLDRQPETVCVCVTALRISRSDL